MKERACDTRCYRRTEHACTIIRWDGTISDIGSRQDIDTVNVNDQPGDQLVVRLFPSNGVLARQ